MPWRSKPASDIEGQKLSIHHNDHEREDIGAADARVSDIEARTRADWHRTGGCGEEAIYISLCCWKIRGENKKIGETLRGVVRSIYRECLYIRDGKGISQGSNAR